MILETKLLEFPPYEKQEFSITSEEHYFLQNEVTKLIHENEILKQQYIKCLLCFTNHCKNNMPCEELIKLKCEKYKNRLDESDKLIEERRASVF